MFNDDVAAICSECGASDVAMDAAKIICQSCGHFDALGLETEASSAELTNLSQAYAISVLQRWSLQASAIVAQSRFPIQPRNCAD